MKLFSKILLYTLSVLPFYLIEVAHAQNISGRYFMDGNPGRVIMIAHLGDEIYRVEEPTSPWPWSGAAVLRNNWFDAIARFRNNDATMMLHGKVRSDGNIEISYIFTSDENNNLNAKIGPGRGRVDNHIWYKK